MYNQPAVLTETDSYTVCTCRNTEQIRIRLCEHVTQGSLVFDHL